MWSVNLVKFIILYGIYSYNLYITANKVLLKAVIKRQGYFSRIVQLALLKKAGPMFIRFFRHQTIVHCIVQIQCNNKMRYYKNYSAPSVCPRTIA
jgi:hypothetical protein